MLGINYNRKEDLIKDINSGRVQTEIYDYFTELQEFYGDINEDEVYEYFEAEIGDTGFIDWKMINNPQSELELLLHDLIANVYTRFNEDKVCKLVIK